MNRHTLPAHAGRTSLLAGAAALALVAAAPALAENPATYGPSPTLAQPDLSHGAEKRSTVVGWHGGAMPKAPDGFKVEIFATGLDYPRWMTVLDNGDVLVSEARTAKDGPLSADRSRGPSADRVTLLRDTDGNGVADERHALLTGVKQPFGLAVHDGQLYVGGTGAVMRYPYKPGDSTVDAGQGRQVVELPVGGYNNHWTRNVVVAPDGKSLFVTVGSASNVGEHGMEEERGRAAIHQVGLDGSNPRLVATGLRNPNGIDFEPATGAMWTAVNERDRIGDDLVPDYVTSVRDGGFYGWPFSYYGQNPDPRMAGKGEDQVAAAIKPDYATGAHTASMDIRFARGTGLPAEWREGAFVSQHGSWNRNSFSGYRVIFLPFKDGRPDGAPRDFLTGFVADAERGDVHGRPTGLAVLKDGSLLVADDAADTIWRVSPAS